MCAYSLRAAGLRVGLYTSPHLQEFRERIRILTPDDPDGLIPDGTQTPDGRSAKGRVLELHRRGRVPGPHPLPRPRVGN